MFPLHHQLPEVPSDPPSVLASPMCSEVGLNFLRSFGLHSSFRSSRLCVDWRLEGYSILPEALTSHREVSEEMVLFLNCPQQQPSTTGMPASSRKECPQVPALSSRQCTWRIHEKACEYKGSYHVPAPSYSGLLLSQLSSFKNLLKFKLLSSYSLSQGLPLSPTLH